MKNKYDASKAHFQLRIPPWLPTANGKKSKLTEGVQRLTYQAQLPTRQHLLPAQTLPTSVSVLMVAPVLGFPPLLSYEPTRPQLKSHSSREGVPVCSQSLLYPLNNCPYFHHIHPSSLWAPWIIFICVCLAPSAGLTHNNSLGRSRRSQGQAQRD